MKKLYKILLSILFVFILMIAGGYYWLINGWKKYLTEDELVIYTSEIKRESPLPKEFKELYFKLYPKQKDASLTTELAERLIYGLFYKNEGGAKRKCACDDAVYYDMIYLIKSRRDKRSSDRFLNIKIGFGLEKYLTNEECLNHYIRQEYKEFKDLKLGYCFERKSFDELGREEIIDFLIARKAPTVYSPWRNRDRYIKAKKKIKERLK
ncbi:MAG: hypothetical protein J7604_07265 [Sporocytophaga sp.]|uniref:hypothetical protein n=1 Tax=Sporocytophaga sp. TaxID=2231183 RepID=UPI001B0729FB|nr:hypothetical protein [Sporocytophaga sp.]MBO9699993.1 hypothetical protein [Sporocytophaga sp.]